MPRRVVLDSKRWLASITQGRIALRVKCHLGEDADAEAELDIRFDHVGILRGQHDVRRQSRVSNAFCTSERLANAKS